MRVLDTTWSEKMLQLVNGANLAAESIVNVSKDTI